MNKLYYGDCLAIMQDMPLGSVDLVYLDPPFNSSRDYNAIYKDETGRPLPDQIEAFCDLWTLDDERERAIRQMPILMRDTGVEDSVAEFWKIWCDALRKTQPRMLAYLSYMTERLLPLRGILKPTGSIYLHCDPTASHYIKVMMDGIFGHGNFRNEVIWHYQTGGVSKRWFGRKHDTILFYSITDKYFIDLSRVMDDRSPEVLRRIREGAPSATRATNEKRLPFDVWNIQALNAMAKERLGYATQKPLALLERIIKASSNEGDVVFDPFCGCATTLEAAHHLKRRWIGIDIAIHAIKRVAKVRLEDRLGLREGTDFEIEGVPHTLEGARDLWERDKYHFQKWAIEQIDGFVTSRKTADGGIDGRLYFSLLDRRNLQSMVLEVKGGRNVNISVVRDLRGTMERESAPMAGLIVMDDPGPRKTANFKREMASAGDLNVSGVLYPRMQMLTVPEIIEGKRFETPSVAKGKGAAQPSLPLG